MTLKVSFFRNLFGIGVCAAVALALGAAYLAWTVPIHKAETRLHIKETNVADTLGISRDRQFIATQAEIIRSPLIVREALEIAPVSLPADFDGDQIQYVMDRMSVSPVLQTDVLSISYRSHSADEAVAMVNALVTSYRKQLRSNETRTNTETLELLTKRETEIRTELARLNEKHLELRGESTLVGQSRDAVNVSAAMLNDLARKLTDARLKKIELANRVASIEVTLDDDDLIVRTPFNADGTTDVAHRVFADVADLNQIDVNKIDGLNNSELMLADMFRDQNDAGSRYLAGLEREMLTAQLRYQHLRQKFGHRHIETRQARSECEKWEELFRKRLSASTDSIRSQYEQVKKAEADLQVLYVTEQRAVKEIDMFMLQDEQVRAEIERTQLIYNNILARLGEIQLTDNALENGQSSVEVRDLQDSKIFAELIWPQPKSFLAICLMVGLCGGFMLTFGMDAMRSHLS